MPKISVVIPVYNVEKYLAECLDSVLAQTLTDIEIICVNDGSPDGSADILKHYAERDKRITIINKENGGLASARNAAYPHLRGKYTLFVDSDDWIDPDLCEKTYASAEETDAPMTMFFYYVDERPEKRPCWSLITPGEKTTVTEKQTLLDFPALWNRLWLTSFLLDHHLYSPEGLIYEDTPVHWKAVILADRICVLSEQLYHYRYNENSIMTNQGKRIFDMIKIQQKIYSFLQESRTFQNYKDTYCQKKLEQLADLYGRCPEELKQEFKAAMRNCLTEEDRKYLYHGKLKRHVVRFYRMEIDGGVLDYVLYKTLPMFRRLETTIRHWFKPPKKKAS